MDALRAPLLERGFHVASIGYRLAPGARHPVVLCDRSVLDNYVYLLLSGNPPPGLEELVTSWLGSYDLLVYVPIVDALRPDGTRSTDPAFQRAVDARLLRELDARGVPTLLLDADDREGWLDVVAAAAEEHLAPPQLPLLA